MLANYRRLFAVPHVLSLLIWSLAARFYTPGLMIAVTFLVQGWTGSYTLAGLVAGAFTLGMALVGPLRGRMADRGNSDRLVLVCGVVFTVGLATLALLPASLWWVSIPLALGTGLFGTPANQIVRALWPRLTTGSERQAIYAAEATTQELIFVFSPILTAGVVAFAGPRWALLLLGILGLMGAVGFALALRRADVTGPAEPDRAVTVPQDPAGRQDRASTRVNRSLLFHPALCLLFAMCGMIVSGVVGMDLVIVAWANELGAPHYVMVLASVWALGSLVGGAVAGALRGAPRLPLRAFGAALGIAVLVPFLPPVSHLPTPLLITPLLFVSGLALAPTLAAAMGRLGDTAPAHRRAEAFGWMATAMSIGAAVAGPLTGALVDTNGIAGGALGAAALVLVSAVLSLFLGRASGSTDREDAAAEATDPAEVSAVLDASPAAPGSGASLVSAASTTAEGDAVGFEGVSPSSPREPGVPMDGPAPAAPTRTEGSPHRPSAP
ncbi:MFS transporter [Nocardiopsis prasina]|uniref:MFS transporter n=1 Tax=Nocardiopsis prasina TaxID=2015 RepID=UPI00034D8D69|nr:MFS transporter [Nocardiopsis prasina]